MKTTEYTTIVLQPENTENWLTQKENDDLLNTTFSKKVFLAVTDSAENWTEITNDEKERIEAEIQKIREEEEHTNNEQ